MNLIPDAAVTTLPSRKAITALMTLAVLAVVSLGRSVEAYSFNGKNWPAGSKVVFQLGLGNPVLPLSDGSASWDAVVAPMLNVWNEKMGGIHLSGVMNSTAAAASGDGVNSVVFAPTVFGQAFGTHTLAVTYYLTRDAEFVEADVVFNQAATFDSYRGELKFAPTGSVIADIARVFLHEIGHAIGLSHPDDEGQAVDAVMNGLISDVENLTADDIAGAQALYGAPAPTPPPTPSRTELVNISTRMSVGQNDDVLIGGFIISGSEPKTLILRAIGPSLAAAGVAGVLQDPVLELNDSDGNLVQKNDDWKTGEQAAQITATGIAPSNDRESAMIVTLSPGNHTAVVRGSGNTEGVGLVEAYVLDSGSSRLVNISTRGRIGVGEEALIGGLIVNGGSSTRVIVRALGPTLGSIAGILADPVLDVRNASGDPVGENNDWASGSQAGEITATGIAPPNPLESAVIATLAPGNYTAIVRGVNDGTGVGLVEVYDLGN